MSVRRLVEEECGGGGVSLGGTAPADAAAVFLNGKLVLKPDRTLGELGLRRGVAVAVRSFDVSGAAAGGRLLGGAQTLGEWLEGKYGGTDPAVVTEITDVPNDATGEWWCRSAVISHQSVSVLPFRVFVSESLTTSGFLVVQRGHSFTGEIHAGESCGLSWLQEDRG